MVLLLLADGFEEMEAITPVDILRRAGTDVVTLGVTGAIVTGAHGIPLVCDCTWDTRPEGKPDMVILPGGGLGVENLHKDPRVETLVRTADLEEALIAAICAAPTLLADWGLLQGKAAVCFPGLEQSLVQGGANIPAHQDVVVDDRIITAKAAGTAVSFALKLTELLKNRQTARELAATIAYPAVEL